MRLSNADMATLFSAIEETEACIQANNYCLPVADDEIDLIQRASASMNFHQSHEDGATNAIEIETTPTSPSPPKYLSPSDEGCPPFECSESHFPSSTSKPSSTNANTLPEKWGMSVAQLNDFVGWCKAHPRWEWIESEHTDRMVSGYELDTFFVRPWTADTGAGAALCMNSDEPKQVNLYLCHAWAEDVEELVQSVNRHCEAHNLDINNTVIWCCIFAIYQNDDVSKGITIEQQVQMNPPPFEAGISSSSTQNGALLCHTQHEDVCDRLWCVFEIFKITASIDDHGYASPLHIGCSSNFSFMILAMWRCGYHHRYIPRSRNAKCTMERDRQYIKLQLEQVRTGFMKVDSAVYMARMQLAKLGCHLDEQLRLQELNLLEFEREFSESHSRLITTNSSWIKLKAAVVLMGDIKKRSKRLSVFGARTKMRGFGDILPTEQSPPPNAWGHQNKVYKKSVSPYVEVGEEDDLIFSYERIQAMGRTLPRDLAQHLWSAVPYHRSGQSTAMVPLTASKLFQMSFGIKQHGFFYLPGERYFDGNYYDFQVEGGGNSTPRENYPSVDIPHGLSFHSGTIKNCTGKRGRGAKFSNYGVNACINVVVTRFDKHGNLQMMAMVRPDDATDGAGEFQLSSSCFFFGSEHGFETQVKHADGHDVEPSRTIAQAEGPTPFHLVSGTNVDTSGKIQNDALVWARAAIFEDHFNDDRKQEDVHTSIGCWNFYLLGSGIVDDVSNTDEAWVETSIVVHHITGHEGKDELSLFETSTPPQSSGLGIWRSIDSSPKEVHTSQYAFVDKNTGQIQHRDIPVKQPYDPYTEFDLWHGDHSFMAEMVGDFVKMHYSYEGPAEFGFGKSQCTPPHSLEMIEKMFRFNCR